MKLNPLLWVHLQLAGGWRQNAFVVGGFMTLVFVGFNIASRWYSPDQYGLLYATWLGILSAAELLFLLIMAPGAIRKAVQRDFQSGMIESNRLSPMSNLKIVLGYLFGAPIQPILLALAATLIAPYFAAKVAASSQVGVALTLKVWVGGWFLGLGCIIAMAVMTWSFVLLFGIAAAGKNNPLPVFLTIALMTSGGVPFTAIPGLSLLLGVLGGGAIFELVIGRSTMLGGDMTAAPIGVALQLLFTALFVWAACSKYRHPERPLFTLLQALVLCAAWGATLIVGMGLVDNYSRFFSSHDMTAKVQLVASLGTFLLTGLFVSSAAASECFHLDRAAVLGQRSKTSDRMRAALAPLLLAAMATLTLIGMINWFSPHATASEVRTLWLKRDTLLICAAAMTLSCLTDFALLYCFSAGGRRRWVAVALLTFVHKVMPLIVDAGLLAAYEERGEVWNGYGYVTSISPIGAVLMATKGGTAVWVGLGVQALIATALYAVMGSMQRGLGRKLESAEKRRAEAQAAAAQSAA